MPNAPVVVITGPPGAGKSTTARLLALRFERSVHFETDWFWSTIVNGFVAPWMPEAADQNRLVLRSFAAAAAMMAAGGYTVVLDGIVGPWFLDLVTEQFALDGVDHHYVVLRPAREVTLARADARSGGETVYGFPALTEEGPVLRMWDQFADLGRYEDSVIDNSDLDAEATTDLVWQRLAH